MPLPDRYRPSHWVQRKGQEPYREFDDELVPVQETLFPVRRNETSHGHPTNPPTVQPKIKRP